MDWNMTDYCINTLNSQRNHSSRWRFFPFDSWIHFTCYTFLTSTEVNLWMQDFYLDGVYLHCGIAKFTSYNSQRVGLHCFFHPFSIFPLQVPAVASRVRRACGGATVTRPVSSIAQTVTRAWGKLERVCVAQATGESPVRTVSVVVSQLTKEQNIKSDQKQKCSGLTVQHLPRLTRYRFVSQNAELVCTVSSAVCHAHPAASRTAATMWQESVIACLDTQDPTVIKVGINTNNHPPSCANPPNSFNT